MNDEKYFRLLDQIGDKIVEYKNEIESNIRSNNDLQTQISNLENEKLKIEMEGYE